MIQKNFLESQEFSRAKSIAVYLNLPDEVSSSFSAWPSLPKSLISFCFPMRFRQI